MAKTMDGKCKKLAEHPLHICQLQRQGLQQQVAARCGNPGFICHNCNAEANLAEDLCNPSPLPGKG